MEPSVQDEYGPALYNIDCSSCRASVGEVLKLPLALRPLPAGQPDALPEELFALDCSSRLDNLAVSKIYSHPEADKLWGV